MKGSTSPQKKTSKPLKVVPLPKEATIRGIVDRLEAQLKESGKKEKLRIAPTKKRRRGRAKAPRPPGTASRKSSDSKLW